MRKVRIVAKTEEPVEEIWEIITDIKNWDKLIKFVKKIEIKEKVEKNSKFYDITDIFWIPTRIEHKILDIEKYKKFQIEAYMPFSAGRMLQTIFIDQKGSQSEVAIEISFKINSSLLDLIFGPILEMRLKEMVKSTLYRLQKNLNVKNIKKGIKRNSEIIT